jgi:predicted signal transduction protein with EAL and GGDEF domain
MVVDIASTLEIGLNPTFLELEITESMIMHNVNEAVQLARAQRHGRPTCHRRFQDRLLFALQPKRFPLDAIKVDRSFIRDIPSDADDVAITSAIIAMGRSLGLTVVAEGVGTRKDRLSAPARLRQFRATISANRSRAGSRGVTATKESGDSKYIGSIVEVVRLNSYRS